MCSLQICEGLTVEEGFATQNIQFVMLSDEAPVSQPEVQPEHPGSGHTAQPQDPEVAAATSGGHDDAETTAHQQGEQGLSDREDDPSGMDYYIENPSGGRCTCNWSVQVFCIQGCQYSTK